MKNKNELFSMKGTVELTLTNCVTGDVEWTHTQENVISHLTIERLITVATLWYDSYRILCISEDKVTPNHMQEYMHSIISASNSSQSGDLANTIYNESDIPLYNPHYYEFNQKFNAPTNTRIINSVCVSNGGVTLVQFANLTVPARQLGTNTNEAGRFGQDLTVRWRTEFFFNNRTISNDTGVGVHKYFGWFIINQIVNKYLSGSARSKRSPLNANIYWQDKIDDKNEFDKFILSDGENFVGVTGKVDYLKRTFTHSSAIGDNVGRLFGSFGFFDDDFGSSNQYSVYAKTLPTDFPNKIQPLHNHSSINTVPFQDTNNLANKNGIVQVTEGTGGWTNPNYPQHFLFDITKSGDVGTSRYTFSKRYTFGYNGNSWEGVSARDRSSGNHFNDSENKSYYQSFNRNTDGDMSSELIEEYTMPGYFVTWGWKSAGITIINKLNGANEATFDHETTPSLDSTSGTPEVNQVAVEEDGTIWVADRINGLHKITFPLSSPNITTYTANTIYGGTPPGPNYSGSPYDGNDSAVYAVEIGYNGRIWCVIDGALSFTDNGGSSWASYDSTTTPSITEGNLDGAFSSITSMKVDREANNHEMVLLSDDFTGDLSLDVNMKLWWWRNESNGETIYMTRKIMETANKLGFYNSYASIFVSRHGGTWAYSSTGDNTQAHRLSSWGQLKGTALTGNDSGTYHIHKAQFFYDNNNTPYLSGNSFRSGSTVYHGLYHGTQVINLSSSMVRNNLGYIRTGSNLMNIESSTNVYNLFGYNYVITPYDSDGYNNSRYIPNTPFSEIVWDTYRWDSSSSPQQWRKNWNSPAIDSASFGPYDGIRKGFETENPEFVGVSSIDASEVLSTNPLTNDVTFVMTVKGLAKDTSNTDGRPIQTADRTLIGMGASRRNNFTLFWDYNGNIRIEEELLTVTTSDLTTVPTNFTGLLSEVHRIVLVVSYTGSPLHREYSVYLDGSQIGSTMSGVSTNSTDLSIFEDLIIGGTSNLREHGLAQQFAGYLEDVQVWDVAFTGTDVTNDYNAWNTASKVPTLTPPAGSPQTLLVNYLLTESLLDTETKATHSVADDLIQNLQITFADNTDAPSFQAGDFYTCGVYDGILKDNVTDWSQRFNLYIMPVDLNHSDFTNASGTNIVPGTTEIHTEPLVFVNNSNLKSYNGNVAAWNSTSPDFNNYGGRSFQHFLSSTDGYIQWKMASPLSNSAMGLCDSSTGSFVYNNSALKYAVRFEAGSNVDYTIIGDVAGGDGVGKWIISGVHVDDIKVGSFVHVYDDPRGSIITNNNGPFEVKSVALSGSPGVNTEITIGGGGHIINSLSGLFGTMRVTTQGTVDIYENGSLVSNNITRFYNGDEFKITRDGTTGTFQLYKNPTGSPVELIHTSASTYTGNLWGRCNFSKGESGFYDCEINYTREAYTLNVGSALSPQTGKYDPDFLIYDQEYEVNLDLYINQGGSPQYVPVAIKTLSDDTALSDTPVPSASGEVIFCDRRTGVLKFHSSDAGKAVIGTVPVVYRS